MSRPDKRIIDKVKGLSNKSHYAIEAERLSISFEYLDWDTELFFVHGLSEKYYHHLFNLFCEVKKSIADHIKLQTHPRLHPKCIRWKNASYITQDSFPSSITDRIKTSLKNQSRESEEDLKKQVEEVIKDSFELMVAKNYGRVHGFLFANKFHVVWFDPAHNLFPGKDENGKERLVRLPKDVEEVRTFCPEEINRIKDLNISLATENEMLKKENEELTRLLDLKTTPAT